MPKQTTRERKILFKAQGTFKGSKPLPNSPYQTAGPFFSRTVLGQQIWPQGTSLDYLEHRLSSSLNDRHNRIGIIGDWKDTHSPQFGGFWSYLYQDFTEIKTPGQKTQYIVHYEESRTSDF